MADFDAKKRALGMLGLAMKAGKVVIGTEQLISFLKARKVRLVLLSGSASEGTKKKIRFKCEFYRTRLIEVEIQTDELGRLLGKSYTPAVVGITDENFANSIMKIFDSENA